MPADRRQVFLVCLAALLGACAFFQPSVAGSDLWWHLASGREIWTRGWVPMTDVFSYTFEGREWMNHEWLWDIVYWGLYRVHPQFLAAVHLSVLVGTYGLVWRLAWRTSGSLAAATIALWFAAASAHWFLDLRPHVYTLLFTAIVLTTCEQPRRFWLWPALMVVWTNVHAGFVFGFGAIGLHSTVTVVQDWFASGRLALRRRDWICVGLCAAAALLNPWGFRILEYPLAYNPFGGESTFKNLIEWHRTGFGLDDYDARGLLGWAATFQAHFWFMAAITALGIPRAARKQPYLLGMATVTCLMALRYRRFIPLFGVCATPVAALGLAGWLAALRARWHEFDRPRARWAGAAAALVAALLFWRDVRFWPDMLGYWTQSDLYPQAAIHYLKAIGQPKRLLNYYNWGGYVMLHLPGTQIFIDGRANTLYDERIMNDYSEMLAATPGLRARTLTYRADAALLPDGGLVAALQKLDPPWRVIYRDLTGVILAPPDSPLLARELPRPDEVLSDEPQFLRVSARRARAAGDLDRAIDLLERVLERDPGQIGAYGDLAELFYLKHDLEKATGVLERGVAAVPRRANELQALEGAILMDAGKHRPALRVLRQSLPTGPFVDPAGVARQFDLVREAQRRSRNPDVGGASSMLGTSK